MKNLLHIMLITFPIVLTAQNWTLTNTNTTDDIRSVYFKNESNGFFLTNVGRIYRTTDGGDNWTFLHQDTDFIDNLDPFYISKEMSIVTTNDSLFCYYNYSEFNGTIVYKSVRLKSSLSSFSFSKDTLNHWMSNPKFWKNEIWSVNKINQIIGNGNNFIVEEYTVSDNYIWATNGLKIYSSDDFGVTWQEHQYSSFPMHDPFQSYYNGSNNMVAVSYYPTTIHKTTDGENWSMHKPSETNHPEVNGSHFYFIDHKLPTYNPAKPFKTLCNL